MAAQIEGLFATSPKSITGRDAMGLTRFLYSAARLSAWIRAAAKLAEGNPRPMTRRLRNRFILTKIVGPLLRK